MLMPNAAIWAPAIELQVFVSALRVSPVVPVNILPVNPTVMAMVNVFQWQR
jgi:hypothetical protein